MARSCVVLVLHDPSRLPFLLTPSQAAAATVPHPTPPPPAAHAAVVARSRVLDGFSWLLFVPSLLQVPFRTLALVQPALAAGALTLMPVVCNEVHFGWPLPPCMAAGVARVAFRGVLLPLLVVYCSELWARRVFLATRVEAAAEAQ